MQTNLQTRQLGKTNLQITTIGLGAWAIGGGEWAFGWGPQDDQDSIKTIHEAVNRGINWIDTAAVYGLGHSEEVVGKALRQLPADSRPFVFSKCGLVWDSNDTFSQPKRILRPESIRNECEQSLKRLGVEQIDLYQFHWPDETGTEVEDSWSTMLELQKEGKVAHVGVSNFDVELLQRCENIGHVDSLQPPFSLLNRSIIDSELPWCKSHSTGILCYSPLSSSILTDNFSLEKVSKLSPKDWRKHSSNFQSPEVEKNIALRDSLKPIAQKYQTTVSSIAIAWVLSWQGITGAIVGARKVEQIQDWIGSSSITLDQDDLNNINQALRTTRAGQGPIESK